MIKLYDKTYTTEYGSFDTLAEAFIEEERNGLFELSFIILNTDSLFNYIKEENIVIVNANDTLLNQKFRIYMTRKLMNNRVEVFARHISFDLMYDYIDNVSFENQSCEYALNQLFRNSNFSKHYKGYSDIINAQDYSMSMANVLEAIGGKQGSIIDTFGTGAEILRDNENIHVLNKRGYDNEVTIEYKKNLTGFELEEDTTDLVTRILPYAKYNDENNGEIIVKADYVDSPLIANYSHPYIASIDYSDKFENDEIPTISKLQELAKKEYRDNKVDIPKQNFKIEFIPLSKCVGYEGLQDKISLCDTVTIVDTRYNINTKAKVIRTVFNVLKNRYESMELGEPRTSLGDIIGNGEDNEPIVGPPGPQGPPGQDGNIGDFPNSLPSTPVVTTTVYGFANIEISWTFENKIYYQYEVYASKEANFTPNTFNLIHQGQTSSFMYQAKPNETWYFKVCCVNSHGERTSFGSAYASTKKVDDLSNYVSNMAIDDALIGTLRLDRGWIGTLRGNYIDAKQLSVTDGNGKRTLDIDSFGNVNLDVNEFKIRNKGVLNADETKSYTDAQFNVLDGRILTKVEKDGIVSSINHTPENIKINSSKINIDGATTIGDTSINRYIAIYRENITGIMNGKVVSQFGTEWDSAISENVPAIYLGAFGFDASSTGQDGRYGVLSHNSQGLSLSYRTLDENGNEYWNRIYFDNTSRLNINSKIINLDTVYGIGINGEVNVNGSITATGAMNVGSTLTCKNINADNFGNVVCNKINAGVYGDNTEYFQLSLAYNAQVYPSVGDSCNLGIGWARWKTIFLTEAPNISSDIRKKENIKYIENNNYKKACNDEYITNDDMYEFIKKDLKLAEYNYKNNKKSTIGFIAQDIKDTKVGKKMIVSCEEEDTLSYDLGARIAILEGALQKAIEKIETLERRCINE